MRDVTVNAAILSRRGSPVRALRHRNFRLFLMGQGVSLIGTWMQSTAQAWLVLTLTKSPLLLGVITALQWGPVLLLGLAGGAVADRASRRRLLVLTQTILMVLAFVLAALTWTGAVRFWHIAVLAVLLGVTNSFDMPTRQSFYVEMVGRDDLANAIGLNSSVVTIGRMIGPAVAGATIARFGFAAAFLVNGLSFLAVIAALLLMDPQRTPPAPPQPFLGHIGEGLRYVAGTPAILTVLAVFGAISAVVLNFGVLLPVLAHAVLRGDAQVYGLLLSASGIGALAGALLISATGRRGPRRSTIFAAAGGVSAAVVALGFTQTFGAAAALTVLAGFAMMVFVAATNSYVQMLVSDELRGRVMAVYSMLLAGVSPVGAMLTGAIMTAWGPRAGFLVAGTLGLGLTGGIGLWSRRLARRDLTRM